MTDMIKVDTTSVIRAAKNIATYNNRIKSDFTSVEAAIKSLNHAWDGKASEKAINTFYDIKNAYMEPRYKVINNYINFLNQQVGAGYTETEQNNKSLADAFK